MKKASSSRSKARKAAPGRQTPAQPGAGKLARRNSEKLKAPDSGATGLAAARQKMVEKFHPHFLGFDAYFHLSDGVNASLLDGAGVGAGNFIAKQIHEAEPLFGLAHNLALLAHGRAAWLTKRSIVQTDARALAVHLQGCERATGTFVQLMKAIAESGQAKTPRAKISIAQANVAYQQVVQNVPRREGEQRKNDEQTGIAEEGSVIEAAVISAVTEGPEIPESCNPEKSTVDKEHRPKNPRGKKQGRNERAKARRAVHCRRRIPKACKDHD